MHSIEEVLTRRVEAILPSQEGLAALLLKRPIRLYQGFDPSAPDLHIGHLVGLLQLKMFQDLGHEVIFLIGDFTGMIGDPTDKSATRPKLTRQEVQKNAQTYQDQAGKILRFEGENAAKIMFNSTWLDPLSFADVLELSSNLTVQQLLERDMFQERLKAQKPIGLHEFMYPMLQGYDSAAMEVDLEIGGNDQMFNMLVGRNLSKSLKGREKYVLTTKLLTDKEGRKIGKTTGNAINLFGDPRDVYGGIMAFPDETVIPAMKLATTLSLKDIEENQATFTHDPMATKKRLAYEIVALCHDTKTAAEAQHHFETTVQQKQLPEEITSLALDKAEVTLLELAQFSSSDLSNAQLKRLIVQGGISLNDVKLTDPNQSVKLNHNDVIKIGKRDFRRISLKEAQS
jgi:tyrosyl-tRNA synthetase